MRSLGAKLTFSRLITSCVIGWCAKSWTTDGCKMVYHQFTNVIGEIYAVAWAFRHLLKDGSDLQRVNNMSRVIWSLLSYVKTCSYLRAHFDHWSMRTLGIVKCVFLFCLVIYSVCKRFITEQKLRNGKISLVEVMWQTKIPLSLGLLFWRH